MKRGQRSQDLRSRRGCSQMQRDKLLLLSSEERKFQPASNLHTCIVALLCNGVRRGVEGGGAERGSKQKR